MTLICKNFSVGYFLDLLRSNNVGVPFAFSAQNRFGSDGKKLNAFEIHVKQIIPTCLPVSPSHDRIVLSSQEETMKRPSAEKPQALT